LEIRLRYRHDPVDARPFGIQKIVGAARALALEPSLLMLDGPSMATSARTLPASSCAPSTSSTSPCPQRRSLRDDVAA
jgi:hypothetical protein